MKTIYIIAAIILGMALYALYATSPGAGDKPVLCWSTWPTPIRQKQIQIFHEWLKKKGYPDIDLKIDFDSGNASAIHLLMAAVTMSVIPVIIMFVVLQKFLVKGIQLGGERVSWRDKFFKMVIISILTASSVLMAEDAGKSMCNIPAGVHSRSDGQSAKIASFSLSELELTHGEWTVVEGRVVGGKLTELKVTPEERRKDVQITVIP